MSANEQKVTSAVALPIRVARFLTEQGLRLWNPEDLKGLQIYGQKSIKRSFLCFKWEESYNTIIAGIYFEHARGDATLSKKWIIEVYGNTNLQTMQELAEKLSKEFKVDIHSILQSEEPLNLPVDFTY